MLAMLVEAAEEGEETMTGADDGTTTTLATEDEEEMLAMLAEMFEDDEDTITGADEGTTTTFVTEAEEGTDDTTMTFVEATEDVTMTLETDETTITELLVLDTMIPPPLPDDVRMNMKTVARRTKRRMPATTMGCTFCFFSGLETF